MSDTNHRGEYSRGYLPHIDLPHTPQFITYRLGDSLPKEALAGIRAETESPEDRLSPHIEEYLDAGHGSCWLRRDEVAEIVVENLHFHDGQKYRLEDWVVMPNHVHVMYDEPMAPMAEILHSWKSYTSNRISEIVETPEEETLWQPGFFDRYLRDEEHKFRTRCYILLNPVVGGLVADPFDWPYSSIHDYQPTMKRSLETWFSNWRDGFWEEKYDN